MDPKKPNDRSEEFDNIEEVVPDHTRMLSSISVYRIKCQHCHHPTSDSTQKRRIILTSIFCMIFMIAEVVGGVLSNSLAIATDAAHMLTDLGAFMVSLVALSLSTREPTRYLNYGFYRAEILGALISVLLIWLLTGILDYMAVQRLLGQEYELGGGIMMIVAIGGIIVNIIMCFMLACDCTTMKPTFNIGLNVRTAFLHVIGDLLQSVAVLVAAGIVYVNPAYKIADPICTFIFSVIILATTLKTIKDIITVLMEGAPKGIDVGEIQKILLMVPGVLRVYNLRIWSLTLEKTALSAHLAIDKDVDALEVLRQAREFMKDRNFFEMTIQIEPYEGTSASCETCGRKSIVQYSGESETESDVEMISALSTSLNNVSKY